MNSTFVNHGHKALTVKVAIAALLAACIALVVGAGSAKAANAGDPITADFNYAGLNVDVTLAQIDELVLTEEDTPLSIAGTYTDGAGNFTLPKETGLVFPDIALALGDGVDLNANIALEEDGSGNYNESTGVMTMEIPIALTIGVSDVAALPIPGLGSGPLSCKFAPINISLSTAGGWPHAGSAFANPATIENGALAGAWRSKPAATVIDGAQATCDLIAGVLKPVGGLWLANSSTDITTMPAATADKPGPETCEESGKIGTFPNCEDPPVEECPEGTTGVFPDCTPIVVPKANISKVAVTPAKGSIKKGKKTSVTIKVTNSGTKAATVTVVIKSNNKQVKAPKSVKVTVGAKKTATKKITISATKKAKGKATITASANKKTGKSVLTVKK